MDWLLYALFVKHFIIDFPLQTPWMYRHKGDWRHPGGYSHATLHGCMTMIIIVVFISPLAGLVAGLADTFAHYLIDWAKVNLTAKFGWSKSGQDSDYRPCLNVYSDRFFEALGADQLAHALTYLVIADYVAEKVA